MDMNVYSVQFIPKLKLKFCEALGIASAFAIKELGERLIRLDQKLDRFETQLRKIHRHQMVLESNQARQEHLIHKNDGPAPTEEIEKKKRPLVKQGGPSARRIKKKQKRALSEQIPDNVTPMPRREVSQDPPVVLMIQSDPKTQEVVREYFGESARVLPVDSMAEIPETLDRGKLVGIFFERNLLSNEQARLILQDLQAGLPQTRFVGVSSYLTLALAKAADLEDDFATYLTQPVTGEDLAVIFSQGGGEPLGDPGEPRDNFIAGRD
jgi:hypothetical protein